jgi:hypothetical protein
MTLGSCKLSNIKWDLFILPARAYALIKEEHTAMSVSKPSLKTQECSISQLIKLEEADKDVALMVADRVTLSGTTPSTIIQYNTSNAESKTLQRIDDVMVELQHSSARLGIS